MLHCFSFMELLFKQFSAQTTCDLPPLTLNRLNYIQSKKSPLERWHKVIWADGTHSNQLISHKYPEVLHFILPEHFLHIFQEINLLEED